MNAMIIDKTSRRLTAKLYFGTVMVAFPVMTFREINRDPNLWERIVKPNGSPNSL